MLKHSDTCEAIRGPWEDHKFETVGNGAERKKVCSVCGYTVAISCLHPTTAWTSDNLEECSLKCADCGFALKTEKHDVVAVAKENDGLTAVLLLNCFINLKEEGKNAKLYKSFRIYDGSIAYGYEYCAC